MLCICLPTPAATDLPILHPAGTVCVLGFEISQSVASCRISHEALKPHDPEQWGRVLPLGALLSASLQKQGLASSPVGLFLQVGMAPEGTICTSPGADLSQNVADFERGAPPESGRKRHREYFPLLLDAQVEGGMFRQALRAKDWLHDSQ